jgi:hypothetical protein
MPIEPEVNPEDVLMAARRIAGGQLHGHQALRDGAGVVRTAKEWAKEYLQRLDPEAAARELARDFQEGRLETTRMPHQKWTRTEACAAHAAKPRSRPEDEAHRVMDTLRKGQRFLATAPGLRKASPVRDRKGRIDVLATLHEHGLVQACPDEETAREARLDASDIAAGLAFQ